MYSSISAVFSTDSTISPSSLHLWEKLWGNPIYRKRSRMSLKIQEKKEFTGFIMPSVLPVS